MHKLIAALPLLMFLGPASEAHAQGINVTNMYIDSDYWLDPTEYLVIEGTVDIFYATNTIMTGDIRFPLGTAFAFGTVTDPGEFEIALPISTFRDENVVLDVLLEYGGTITPYQTWEGQVVFYWDDILEDYVVEVLDKEDPFPGLGF